MKRTLLCAFLLFLPAALLAADKITIQAKFIESSRAVIPHDFAKLAKIKGIALLSAPRITAKAGQEAQIEIIREHQPASVAPSGFKPVPVGITVRVNAAPQGDRIAYRARLTFSELVASKAPDGQTLTEITSRDLYVSGKPKNGEEVWFDYSDTGTGKRIVVWLHFQHEPG